MTENKSVKSMIKEALTSLLQEKTYMDITVTDVVKRAGVARASFYRNFSSVGDVLDAVADDEFMQFETYVLPVISGNDEREWRGLLFNIFYNFPRHPSLKQAKHPENMGEFFSRMDIRIQKIEGKLSSGTIGEKYTAFGKMGLIDNVLKKWMLTGMTESPEEMVNYLMGFIMRF